MPVPSKPLTAELIAEARRLYERTNVPVADICLMLGIGSPTFYRRVAEWKWRKRLERIPVHEPPPPRLSADPAVPAAAVEAADDGASLVVRLQRTAEREIAAIEQVLAKFGPNSGHIGDAERAARTLASLARTLREIDLLKSPAPDSANSDDDDNDDRIPRDLDELRREVSRRLDRLVADAKAACPDEREGT
jgi:hypothetical protein